MSDPTPDQLLSEARNARNKAITPYSKYRVGAALLTGGGEIISAGNIESSTYGLTLCAERVALFSALAQGYREFEGIAIATENLASPCGACRQLLWEFAGNCTVYLTNGEGETESYQLSALFPRPFDDTNLSGEKS